VQAEFGWDVPGEVSRGLGDYRIPKAMLTSVDGKRINVSDIAAHQGAHLASYAVRNANTYFQGSKSRQVKIAFSKTNKILEMAHLELMKLTGSYMRFA